MHGEADLILHHGAVHTLDEERPRTQALACRGGRLIAVGTDQEVLATRGSRTRCLDLQGRLVLPGFVDAHIHFTEWALGRRQIDLRETQAPEQAAALVARRAGSLGAGSWITGTGFDPNRWPNGSWPDRHLLDAAAPEHPVLLSSKDMHSCWMNTRGLRLAGISRESRDPEGGRIEREPGTGEPTGILRERAMDAARRQVPQPGAAEAAAAIAEALPLAWAAGLTSVHEIYDTPEALSLRAWQLRRRGGPPGLRVYHHFPLEQLESAIQLGVETGLGDEWLRLAGVKLFADGALGSRTAHLLEPYRGTTSCGVPVLAPAELRDIFGRADRAGIAVSVHAIGDRANREVLDAVEALGQRQGQHPRHRVEHVQLLHPDDLPRFRRLGLIASMQPIHATQDLVMAEEHWGAERCRHAYAWRSLLESGARLCFGSDAPVESFSVLDGLRAAVTRRRDDGSPGPEGWIPEQRLEVEQALRAYTLGAAFASGEEHLKGSLTPGKLADAVVLSDDIVSRPQTLSQTRVEMTVLGGQVVHGEL